ncbi:MAG: SpoIIE family protein phosphatase [Geminicoccaceae bacterium]
MARARSFQRSLLTNILLIVLLFGVVLAGVAHVALRETLRRSSGAVMTEVVEALASSEARFYASLEQVFVLVQYWARHRWDSRWDPDQFDEAVPPLLLAFTEASSLYLAQENGDFYFLSHETDGSWTSWTVRPKEWPNRVLVRSWDDTGGHREEHWEDRGFDVTLLPWFKGAVARAGAVGADAPIAERIFEAKPQVSPTTGNAGRVFAFMAPAVNSSRLVFGFDRSLSALSERLGKQRVLENGIVANLYGPGSSTADLVYTTVPRTDDPNPDYYLLKPVAELPGPVASFVAAAAPDGSFASGRPTRFADNHETWLGLARPVTATLFARQGEQPNWIVAVIPEADLRRRLPSTPWWVLGATALAMLAAAWRASSLARSYAQPVDVLVDQSRRMQRLDFEQPTEVRTDIVEIGILGRTLESMRRALRSYASISEEVRIADAIVRASLPQSLPRPPGYEIEGAWKPAGETGGEVFDAVVRTGPDGGDEVALLLLDPDGFGVEAAVLTAQLRAVFRTAKRSGADVQEIAGKIGTCLREDIRDPGAVRGAVAVLDAASGRLRLCCAGLADNAVHVRATAGTTTVLASTNPPFGASTLPGEGVGTVHLEPGDVFLVASNGVLDLLDAGRHRYGVARLESLLRDSRQLPAEAQLAAIDRALLAFAGTLPTDADRTLLLVRRLPRA